MNGATAICDFASDSWGASAFTDEVALEGQNARGSPRNVVEDVPVTFEDADERSSADKFGKRVYRVMHQQPGLDGRSYVSAFRAEPWQFSCAAEANTTVSSGSLLLGAQSEPDPSVWRGVFAIRHRRRGVYAQTVELDLRSLQRRRPLITLTRRMLEANDE